MPGLIFARVAKERASLKSRSSKNNMSHDFGHGKLIHKSKGFDKAEAAHAKTRALHAKKGPKYHDVLSRMYGGSHKIPLEAVKRAAEGKGRSSAAYSKFLEKNK